VLLRESLAVKASVTSARTQELQAHCQEKESVSKERREAEGEERSRRRGGGRGGADLLLVPDGCSPRPFSGLLQPARTQYAGTKRPLCCLFAGISYGGRKLPSLKKKKKSNLVACKI